MKLASYKDGSRDGQLVVVSRDLKTAHYATGMATRMQHLLDDWGFISPQLQDLYDALNQGRQRHAFAFDPKACAAPLARAYLCAESLYAESVCTQDGERGLGDAMACRPADLLSAAFDDISASDEAAILRASPGVAAITGDVPRGVSVGQALEGVRLLALACSVSIRTESAWWPVATLFGPIAITPDELGAAWQGGRIHLDVGVQIADDAPATQSFAAGMRQHLGESIALLGRHRPVAAGSIVIADSQPQAGSQAKAQDEVDKPGVALRPGDRLRIDIRDGDGHSPFGAIDTRAVAADRTSHASVAKASSP